MPTTRETDMVPCDFQVVCGVDAVQSEENPAGVQFIHNEQFAIGSSDDFLTLPKGCSMYADRDDLDQVEVGGSCDLDQLDGLPLLSVQGETFLFLKLNYLKYQADLLQSSSRGNLTEASARQMRYLLEDAESVRNHIAECNVRLVVSIARKFANAKCDMDELVSEGTEILLKAISKFDVSRGFRFSTYATHSVQRHFCRHLQKASRRQTKELRSGMEQLNELPQPDADAEIGDWILQEQKMTEVIACMAKHLDERECAVVTGRFGLNESQGAVLTLRELAEELGLSKERVRQIQIAALQKLRVLFDELPLEMSSPTA